MRDSYYSWFYFRNFIWISQMILDRLESLLETIKQILLEGLNDKVARKYLFEININQGGIGDCKEIREGKLIK